ncbi:thiamine phosphate synthase [Krasilnikovia sp. MM14-A1259]|uniref:thiamine phosphate synthase n=1 Tax=Krasilnikovia sp. MM14-A1259 TaxID=3373539 RepID=UPI00380D67A2
MVSPGAAGPIPSGSGSAGPIPSGIVLLTDRRVARMPLTELVAAAAPDWVVLRERDLPAAQRRELADRLRAVLPPGRLIVAGPDPLGGDAVHLAERDPTVAAGLVGRSCHAAPLLSTEDYVTLSPIFTTASKPGYGPALGPGRAAELVAAGRSARGGAVPWLALGGIDSPEKVAECLAAGASGVAVMGAVMRSADPAATVARLRAAAAVTR